MTNNKYYKLSYNGRIAKDAGSDYNMNRINNDTTFRKIHIYILPGVYVEVSERVPDTIRHIPIVREHYPTDEERALFDHKPEMITLDEIKRLSLAILNEIPGLGGATCMGWAPYEDKSKDPNMYSDTFIFTDGNKYSIIKSRSRVEVYPCAGDHCLMMSESRAPIVKFAIDPVVWAKRKYENDLQSIITEI